MVSRRVQALLEQLRAQGIQDEQVLNALAAVPREKFVDEAFEQKAWDNIALPIGQGQTISQPYMVARMTELLELTPCFASLVTVFLRPLPGQANRQTRTARYQWGIAQGFSLNFQMVFGQRIKHRVAVALLL